MITVLVVWTEHVDPKTQVLDVTISGERASGAAIWVQRAQRVDPGPTGRVAGKKWTDQRAGPLSSHTSRRSRKDMARRPPLHSTERESSS